MASASRDVPAASRGLLFALSLALGASCQASRDCPELGAASGLGAGAALLRLEIYPPSARCAGNGVDAAGNPPLEVRDFDPRAPASLDLPPGAFVVHLLAYADGARTRLLGEGCTATAVRSRETSCVALALFAPADGGASDAASTSLDAAAPDATALDATASDAGPAADAACTPVAHSNGLGQSYFDCAPVGPVDARLAREACEAADPAGRCEDVGCSGGRSGRAICDKLSPCTCWTYSGDGAGLVHAGTGGGCDCGQGADPAWN